MLAVLILSVCFAILGSDATINEMFAAGHQANLQNFMPPPQINNFNPEIKGIPNNPPLIQPKVAANPQNGIQSPDCPNTAILLNILNILTSSMPQDDKTVLDPVKFKPSGVPNILPNELKNVNGVQNPLFYMNPENNQAPSLYPPMNELNGKDPNLQPTNIYQPPNMNTGQNLLPGQNGMAGNTYANQQYATLKKFYQENNFDKAPNLQPTNIYQPANMNPMQNILPGQNGLPGNTYANQQYANLKKFYQENNFGLTSSISGMKTPWQSINGQNSGILNTHPNELFKKNPSDNKDPNHLIDIFKQVPNPAQNLHNTNIKITHAEINKIPNFVDSTRLANNNMHQYLQQLQNMKIQQSIPQNILSQKPILPQQSMTSYFTYGKNQILNQYTASHPTVGVNSQLPYQNGLGFNQNGMALNQNGLGLSQNYPFISGKYNKGQNMFTDNTKQENNGGQLLDLNHLLGVANQGKLNSIPIKNGIVELTYMLNRPKPVYESQYYVKYRLPYQTFLYNLQNLMIKKPYLRNQPGNLYQELLVGSNVTDTSIDLEGLNYDTILKLTSTNGTLVTAKILDSNDTTVDKTLRLVQRLNSNLPVETIIDFNRNATKDILLQTQPNDVNGTKNSTDDNKNSLNSVNPTLIDLQRRLYLNNYPYTSIGQYSPRLQYNPYSAYQTKPGPVNMGMPLLKYGSVSPNTNIVKKPILYSPSNYYPQLLGR